MVKDRRSGQVLILTALTIAALVISTEIYLYRLSETRVDLGYDLLCDYVLNIRLSSRRVVEASLANVTWGGPSQTLSHNLERWSSFLASEYRLGICTLTATPRDAAPYTSGLWIDWGSDGRGVSSAFSSFDLRLSGRGTEVNLSYTVNVTTTLLVSGSYTAVAGNEKAVEVWCRVLNEGSPALAENITLLYFKGGAWRDPTTLPDYTYMDYGNGTYLFSFSDVIPGDVVTVSARCYDRRTIYVEAEAECREG